jgi:hypothetical protein
LRNAGAQHKYRADGEHWRCCTGTSANHRYVADSNSNSGAIPDTGTDGSTDDNGNRKRSASAEQHRYTGTGGDYEYCTCAHRNANAPGRTGTDPTTATWRSSNLAG